MAQTTVEQFAGELKLPTALLLEQLKSAGVHKSNAEDQLSESDKTALLDHLRKEHGIVAKKYSLPAVSMFDYLHLPTVLDPSLHCNDRAPDGGDGLA